jgi:peptidyl-prolyl cis-trans isomerase D
MISSFRNFAKTKFAGLLVILMIIPFVFWGMGSMFSGGNTNNLAKINKTNISTQEFINYLNSSNISQKAVRENLNNNIIEELLSGLVSTTLLNLEIEDFNIILSKNILLKKIKGNKDFHDEKGVFQRIKYEKFLLENNTSASIFEQRLKSRELQKNLFDFIGAGTSTPRFLINKLFEEENKKLELQYINLDKFYKSEFDFNDQDLLDFIDKNKEQLKIEYINFNYTVINPKNLIGVNEFNQAFFDKIDQIENDVSNGVKFESIVQGLNIKPIKVDNFRYSTNKSEIEKKIFEIRNIKIDIIENGDDYILYNILNTEQRKPNLTDNQTKNEILQLVMQKNKFDYNRELLKKIRSRKFDEKEFTNLGQDKIETTLLTSIKDNKKFDIKSVELLYSLPVNSFTLISDVENRIYLTKIKKIKKKIINTETDDYKKYINKQNSNSKNNILKSYDRFLNDKYNVVINEKTIDRVKNFFQ